MGVNTRLLTCKIRKAIGENELFPLYLLNLLFGPSITEVPEYVLHLPFPALAAGIELP
jgi:hypothetical protein